MNSRKILAFVVGMSPAIISETIYALATQTPKWVPDEIVVFTTASGAEQIKHKLLDSGIFSQLCAELAVKIYFDFNQIKIVEQNNQKLDDIRSVADNSVFADFITFELYRLCNDDSTQLYVSLAGGRKTMGYYIGYALSLFGRRQDKLLHVLVNQPFDSISEFFYPPQITQYYSLNGREIASDKAKIELADIPFVRMRYSLPKELLTGKISFSQAVATMQMVMLENIANLSIDYKNKVISCNDTEIKLPAFHIALYSYFAKLKQFGDGYCTLKQINTVHLLDIFASCLKGGRNSARFAQISITLHSVDFEAAIRSAISKINAQLRRDLGHQAFHFTIEAIKNMESGFNQYGIKVNVENITIL